jgi:Protein of unknown function (DUF3245)
MGLQIICSDRVAVWELYLYGCRNGPIIPRIIPLAREYISFWREPPTKNSSQRTCEMATDERPKSAKVSKEDFDVISNRIAVALAKRESLIKSWTASSSRPRDPEKTEAELEAEDAALFRNEPPYLGVGASIPSHFLVSEAERSNKSLRAKFFPSKTLKASKARDAEEKAASAKRGLKDESSDEEEGRSGLGRAKKRKTQRTEPVVEVGKDELDHIGGGGDLEVSNTEATKTDRVAGVRKIDLVAPKIQATRKAETRKSEGSKTDMKNQELARSPEPETEKEDNGLAEHVAAVKGASKQVAAILQKGVMDPEERKRMKKREKRKRQKEKLRAAGKA